MRFGLERNNTRIPPQGHQQHFQIKLQIREETWKNQEWFCRAVGHLIGKIHIQTRITTRVYQDRRLFKKTYKSKEHKTKGCSYFYKRGGLIFKLYINTCNAKLAILFLVLQFHLQRRKILRTYCHFFRKPKLTRKEHRGLANQIKLFQGRPDGSVG